MQYKRIFVTLKQENPNYALVGEAMGRCIIESRGGQGKISFIVQNLKPQIIYKAYIISNIGSHDIMLGSLVIDSKGRGELKKNVNTYDVEGTGLSLGDFEAAVVLVGEKEEIISPLVGYVDREIRWKDAFRKSEEHKANTKKDKEDLKKSEVNQEMKEDVRELESEEKELIDEMTEEIKVNQVDEVIKDENLKEEASNEENQGEEKTLTAAEFKPVKDNIPKIGSVFEMQSENNIQNNEFSDEVKQDGIHEVFKVMAKEVNKQITEFKNYTLMIEKDIKKYDEDDRNKKQNLSKSKINSELEHTFLHNMKMVPFKKQLKSVRWVRISLKETVNLPIDFWNLINDPFIVNSFKKYNHLILGLYDGGKEKEYILGVPDVYKEENKARANAMGFIQFKCCDEVKLEENIHGYWIMPIPIV